MRRSRKSHILQIVCAALAVALAGTASAAGWRNLRIDASSEASFAESVAAFQEKLSPSRRIAFARSLQDVWRERAERATAEQREYTSAEYLQELDGLGYEQVTRLVDPTGDRAKRYRAEYYYARAAGGSAGMPGPGSANPLWASPTGAPPPVENGVYRGATRSIDHQTH
jgi:hypothetical protein